MKISLFMWTKNSAKYLYPVLTSIEKAIPDECIKDRIIIDDGSEDNTRIIARDMNWKIFKNLQGGICGGFNRTLDLVDTKYFATFEHDIILNPKWFDYMIEHTRKKGFIVCQGLRVPSNPILKVLYEHKLENNTISDTSLDNNLWHTGRAKMFLRMPPHYQFVADSYQKNVVSRLGLEWIVDRRVISIHIRESIKDSKNHYEKMMLIVQCPQSTDNTKRFLQLGLDGILAASKLIFTKKMPKIFVVYPYMALRTIKVHVKRRQRRG